MVAAYFQGPEFKTGGLDGEERLLRATLELDRGLWNATPIGCSSPAPLRDQQWWELSNNAALFRDHSGRKPTLGHAPGTIWRWGDESFRPDARNQQIGRIVSQIARHDKTTASDLPEGIEAAIRTYPDAVPVETPKARKRRPTSGRLRPDLSLMALFADWQAVMQPSLQSAHEYEGGLRLSFGGHTAARYQRGCLELAEAGDEIVEKHVRKRVYGSGQGLHCGSEA